MKKLTQLIGLALLLATSLGAAQTNLSLSATTDSTSTNTGALTVAGGVGIAKSLNVGGKMLFSGDLTATPLQVRYIDVHPRITNDGDIYGLLVRPTRASGTAGEVLAVEGYLAGTPHTANSRRNIAVTGDARSEKGVFTGSVNIGVWGIATAADKNVSIYGSNGQAVFNGWVGIGLSDDGSVLKPVPVLASYPLHARDKRTLAANENSTKNTSVLLHKMVDGAGTYSESAPVLALRRTITNVTGNAGNFMVADDGLAVFFTLSNAGAITAASTITATNGLRATAGGLTVTAGNINFVAGDLYMHNPKKIYFDAGYTVSIGATGNGGVDKDMQFFAGGGGAGTERMRISSTGGVGIGSTALTLTNGALGLNKIAASGSAPGAAGGKIELVCGTNAGSAKLIAIAGTSSTAVTILDNIGSGVNGC